MHRLACGESIVKLYTAQPPVSGRSPRGVRASTGIRYFTILVDNLEQIVRRAEAAGCEFHVPLKEYRPGEWYAQVYDPDGNVVALTQGND
jgi:predicted enzyme related to lactoylglutathione lyase